MSGDVHSERVTGEECDVDFAQFRRPVLAVERSPTGVARTVGSVEVVTFLDEDGSERPWEGQNVVVFGVGVENALDDAAGFARGVVAGVGDEGDDQSDVPVGGETPVSASDSPEEQNPRRRSPRRLRILRHRSETDRNRLGDEFSSVFLVLPLFFLEACVSGNHTTGVIVSSDGLEDLQTKRRERERGMMGGSPRERERDRMGEGER